MWVVSRSSTSIRPATYEKPISFFCCCQLIGSTPVREPSVRFGGCRPSMTASTISGARKATRRMQFMYRDSSPVALASARWCLHSPDSILRTQSLARLTALTRDETGCRRCSMAVQPGMINRISPPHLRSVIAIVSTTNCSCGPGPRVLSWFKSRARIPSFET